MCNYRGSDSASNVPKVTCHSYQPTILHNSITRSNFRVLNVSQVIQSLVGRGVKAVVCGIRAANVLLVLKMKLDSTIEVSKPQWPFIANIQGAGMKVDAPPRCCFMLDVYDKSIGHHNKFEATQVHFIGLHGFVVAISCEPSVVTGKVCFVSNKVGLKRKRVYGGVWLRSCHEVRIICGLVSDGAAC